ncbi:MAG TPA: hypothetical protein DCZ59_01810 [Bacteroidetes bacterium]|nr:hypothetical protein [Bacteroidota bacterium]
MYLILFLLSTVLACAQNQDFVISRTERHSNLLRLTQRSDGFSFHDAYLVRVRSVKGRVDSAVTPVVEIQGGAKWVEVLGRTPDSAGIVLSLTDAAQRGVKKFPRTIHAVLTDDGADGYHLRYVDDGLWASTRDVVQGARMVHKGETKLPISDLEPIDLKSNPFRQLLSTGAYTMAKIDRIEPMWLLSEESSGARAVLNYGYDEDGQSVVQIVRLWYFPLKRLVYCRGAIVSVVPERNMPPAIGVFDESQDSSRFARVTVYGWQPPDADTLVDGRYAVRTMNVMSSCVIPPKTWLPFPLLASVTRQLRLGFAPGQEGCSALGPRSSGWPFEVPLAEGTTCHIVASALDASQAPWYFVSLRQKGDAAMRRTFGDYTAGDEEVVTSGWLPANALTVTGVPSVVSR